MDEQLSRGPRPSPSLGQASSSHIARALVVVLPVHSSSSCHSTCVPRPAVERRGGRELTAHVPRAPFIFSRSSQTAREDLRKQAYSMIVNYRAITVRRDARIFCDLAPPAREETDISSCSVRQRTPENARDTLDDRCDAAVSCPVHLQCLSPGAPSRYADAAADDWLAQSSPTLDRVAVDERVQLGAIMAQEILDSERQCGGTARRRGEELPARRVHQRNPDHPLETPAAAAPPTVPSDRDPAPPDRVAL